MSFNPLGLVGGQAIGTGVGGGITTVIEPILRGLANEAWEKYQSMPLQAVLAANVVASGERSYAWGLGEAHKQGLRDEAFQALVDFSDTAPDLATLYDLLHRQLISEADFREGAHKQLIEEKWLSPLVTLAQRVLSPAEAANAWQQGFMSEGEAAAEAERSGVSPARSAIQRELAGLPPGAMDGLTLLRRGIIDEATYAQIVREGHTKTKYTADLLALRDHVLNGRDVAGLWLRGWLTENEAKQLGALDGWGPEEMERLYQNRGRPATTRQVHIGYARGAKLAGAANEEAAIRTAVKQSNIRTEYADLLYAQRFTYPSAFVIRALAQDGTFPPALTETILVESGWRPAWAKLAADKWGGAAGAGPSTKWADRARSSLFTALHSDYVDLAADEAVTREGLTRVGATGPEQDAIIALWEFERQSIRRELTQPQILKLYKKAIWTREQAQAALEDMGMEAGDAGDLLDAV